MCKRYETHFLMFLNAKKSKEEKINRNNDQKETIQNHLVSPIPSSLERVLETTKSISREIEAQRRIVRYNGVRLR